MRSAIEQKVTAAAQGGNDLQLETHWGAHQLQDLIPDLAMACLIRAFWEESSQSVQSAGVLHTLSLH